MGWLGEQWRTFRMRWRRDQHDQELADEMALHLELRAEHLRQAGLATDEARDTARRQFGNVTLQRELSRDVWSWPRLETIGQDLRYAVRVTLKSPGFAAVVIITMALGIGANTAVFALLHGLLLRPPAVADADRLVVLFAGREESTPYRRLSYPNYLDVQARASTLASVASFCWPVPLDLSSNGEGPAERVWAQVVSGNFFDVLGVPPALGRTFLPAEDRARNTHLVTVVSQEFWRARLGADPSALGRTIRLNGRLFTVIGVAPREAPQVDPPFEPDLWVPMAVQALVMPGQDGKLDSRTETWLRGVGRLQPTASIEQAQAELTRIASDLALNYPAENRRLTLTVRNQEDARAIVMGMFGATGLTWVLFGLVGLVLLIACANLAGILSVRALTRTREMSVRASLGAGRARLFRQVFTESSLLVVIGSVAGITVASVVSTRLWTLVVPPLPFPVRIDAAIDGPVLVFAVASTCLTALLFGLLPALHVARLNLAASLKGTGVVGPSRGQRGVHAFLVASQVALSVVVLIAATLFVRSLAEASHIDVGFAATNRTIATVQLGRQGYSARQVSQFYEVVLARLRALPGVRAVTTTAFLPLSGGYLGDRVIYREDEATPEGDTRPAVILDRVGPDYFRTTGTTLLRGRDITDADRVESPAVAVINETFARTFWPGADPVGRRFRIGAVDAPLVEVIGLAPDGRYQSLREQPQRRMFLPVRQDPQLEISWIVHADTSPSVVLDAIRRDVRAIDVRLPVINATTLQAHVDRTLAQAQVFAVLATVFGIVALLLASVGIYGMLSLMVRGRTREIGIRMALGARPSQVLHMVVRQGAVLAAAGLATGALIGGWTSRALAPMLYGVTAFNTWTLLVVACALGSAVLLASALPARRALRIDPAMALRQD